MAWFLAFVSALGAFACMLAHAYLKAFGDHLGRGHAERVLRWQDRRANTEKDQSKRN